MRIQVKGPMYSNEDKLKKENKELRRRLKLVKKIISKYELGKYNYSIDAYGIMELKDAIKGRYIDEQ